MTKRRNKKDGKTIPESKKIPGLFIPPHFRTPIGRGIATLTTPAPSTGETGNGLEETNAIYPMKESIERTQSLFVVRIWQETDAATATKHWRGSVKKSATDEWHHFSRPEELCNFIMTLSTRLNDDGQAGMRFTHQQ